jgi:predicted NUDIX family phosphoesterase
MFKNKEQIMVIPVNYMNHLSNGFTPTNTTTKISYGLYDSIGLYRPLYEVENNICLIRPSVLLIIKNKEDKYLVKELKEKEKRPNLEMGLNSYIKSSSGNNKAVLNQIESMSNKMFEDMPDFKYLGTIRDLANEAVKSIVGLVYYAEIEEKNFIVKEKHWLYDYKWYNKKELIDRYNKSTSWTRKITDMIVDKSFNEYIGRS